MSTDMLYVYIACLVVHLAGLGLTADFSQAEINSLTDMIEAVMQCRNIPGLCVAMVRENATDVIASFGKRDIDRAHWMHINTLLCLSDLTQGFTATLAARLVSETNGSVEWDAPLRNILGAHLHMQVRNLGLSTEFHEIISFQLINNLIRSIYYIKKHINAR